ncbi:maltoporin [Piscinibacter terrae]|uniref:Carbohydrate porin n=1 Tax=Piscinibacter terrae TaxID=2496871 RepID=A0A3N7HLN4_9BURK|nr:carbohydrate porin [Albitalea terrae]RQP23004.1 carbohydrate porin [Albitalea terrae]
MHLPKNLHMPLFIAALALAAAWATPEAQAVDMDGYMRAGPGAAKKDAARACYGLQGPGLKYRLGNECDIYGEFGLSQVVKTEGVSYKVKVMPNLWNPSTDSTGASVGLAQMFVEGSGFDFAPDTLFWAGKRFLGRADVHIVDTYFVTLDGVGAGAEFKLGDDKKLGLSYFHTDASATESGDRLHADLTGLNVNPGGKLRVLGTLARSNFTGGHGGVGLVLQHDQDNFLGLGGGNTAWLAYTRGSAGLDGNFGNLHADSGDHSLRLVESITWQQGPLGGQALALWQNDQSTASGKVVSTSLGGRVSYAMTKHLKLLAEAGYSTKKPEGGERQKLAKFTVGPAVSIGPDFWNRPELRLYVTTARWNDAANAAAGAGGVTGLGDGKTSGTSYGAQFEIWF